MTAAEIILQEKGYSLLLIVVTSLSNRPTKKFFVGIKDEKAAQLVSKSTITVLDYERCDIIRGFPIDQEILDNDLISAKEYFVSSFVPFKSFKFNK